MDGRASSPRYLQLLLRHPSQLSVRHVSSLSLSQLLGFHLTSYIHSSTLARIYVCCLQFACSLLYSISPVMNLLRDFSAWSFNVRSTLSIFTEDSITSVHRFLFSMPSKIGSVVFDCH